MSHFLWALNAFYSFSRLGAFVFPRLLLLNCSCLWEKQNSKTWPISNNLTWLPLLVNTTTWILKGRKGHFGQQVWEILGQNKLNRTFYTGLQRAFPMLIYSANLQEGCSIEHSQDYFNHKPFSHRDYPIA